MDILQFILENLRLDFILTLFVFGALFCVYFTLIRRDPYVEKQFNRYFHGPKPYPGIGNGLDLLAKDNNVIPIFDKLRQVHGPLLRLWMGNRGFAIITKAEDVEKVLSSNVNIDKATEYELIHSWLGLGLLTSNGSKWHKRRKILTPAFHFKILEEILPTMNENSDILVDLLDAETQKLDGKPFDISPFLTRCALDIIYESAMGKKINAQLNPNSEYVTAINEIGLLIVKRFLQPWLRPKLIWALTDRRHERAYLKILHKFTQNVIEERKKERKNKIASEQTLSSKDDFSTGKKRLAFLDLLLDISDDGKVLSDLDIREEVDTFAFEGHDTTSSNFAWIVVLMATHPEHQRKVQEELDEIFGDDPKRALTLNDLTRMKYLECCIKESLRIFPSVHMFGRNIIQDTELACGAILPKGCVAMLFTYSLHRDTEYFPDPEVFDPTRFYPENVKGRHPYSFVPFSAGPRNCIGQKFAMNEERIVLAKLLRNFTLSADVNHRDIQREAGLVLKPFDKIKIKLTKRV